MFKSEVFIVVVVPLTVKLPPTITSPVTSKVAWGSLLKIPILLVEDLIVTASV
jgi:hypothetical protein